MKTQKPNIKVRDLEPRKNVTAGGRRRRGRGFQGEGFFDRDFSRGGSGPGHVAPLLPQ